MNFDGFPFSINDELDFENDDITPEDTETPEDSGSPADSESSSENDTQLE